MILEKTLFAIKYYQQRQLSDFYRHNSSALILQPQKVNDLSHDLLRDVHLSTTTNTLNVFYIS